MATGRSALDRRGGDSMFVGMLELKPSPTFARRSTSAGRTFQHSAPVEIIAGSGSDEMSWSRWALTNLSWRFPSHAR
jgi:hypothetical protein